MSEFHESNAINPKIDEPFSEYIGKNDNWNNR